MKAFVILCVCLLGGPWSARAQEPTTSAPARSHPYLYFSAADIPTLRARIDDPAFAARWERFLRNANLVRSAAPANNARMSYAQGATSAFAYVMTGDAAYANRAIQEALHALTSPRATGWFDPRPAPAGGANLGTAEYALGIALVYDWCYDVLTPEQRQTIVEGLNDKAFSVYLKSLGLGSDPTFVSWWVDDLYREGGPRYHPLFPFAESNWAGVVNGAMGIVSLALYDESPLARETAPHADRLIRRFSRHSHYKDGSGLEGIMYHLYGLEYSLHYLMAAVRNYNQIEQVQELTDLNEKLAGYFFTFMWGSDGKVANFNNMGETRQIGLWSETGLDEGGPRASPAAVLEALAPGGDPLLRWAADNGGEWYIWRGASPFNFIFRRDSSEAPAIAAGDKPPVHEQEAVLFRETGQAIFQSPRLWFAENATTRNTRMHNRRDLGTYILAVGGKRFVHSPDGTNVGDTLHHSTVRVNGANQTEEPYATKGRLLRFGSGKNFHYLASDITTAYHAPMARFIRHAVMIGGSYMLVVDDLAAREPAEFDSRVMTRTLEGKSVTAVDDVAARINGGPDFAHDLHVVPVSTAEALQVTTGAMPGQSLFINIRPTVKVDELTLAYALYPTAKTADGRVAPRVTLHVNGDIGTIRIAHEADGVNDEVVFSRAGGQWELQSVKGESAAGIPDGSERTIVPLRDISVSQVPRMAQGPSWFFAWFREELDRQLAAAQALTRTNYTTASWSTLESALATATTVRGSTDSTVEQAHQATTGLRAAIAALVAFTSPSSSFR